MQEWKEFYKGHPKAKTLRTSPLPFLICASYCLRGLMLLGHVPMPLVQPVRGPWFHYHHFYTILTLLKGRWMKMRRRNDQVLINRVHLRLDQKRRVKQKLTWMSIEMRGALRTLVAKQAPSFDECLEMLNILDLDPMSTLYGVAVDIFGHKKLLREAWMAIPPNP